MLFSLASVAAVLATQTVALPAPELYQSLGGMSARRVDEMIQMYARAGFPMPGAQDLGPPLANQTVRRVNDEAHPYIPPGPNDQRGPCPGLNTLANHGYINRSGVVTPQELVLGVQQGFNMKQDLATFVGYSGFLNNGNMLTNLLSIGGKTQMTGPDTEGLAPIGGLDFHGTFEGDTSMVHDDAFFASPVPFSESIFDNIFVPLSNQFGGSFYDPVSAAMIRGARTNDSIARNPQLDFSTPRYFTAYAESVFPFRLWVDGRNPNSKLAPTDAKFFFDTNTYPSADFHCGPAFGLSDIVRDIAAMHQIFDVPPGGNNGQQANTYTPTPNDLGVAGGACFSYQQVVKGGVSKLYPNATGPLRAALDKNLQTFYNSLNDPNCTQIFLPNGTSSGN